VQHVTRRDAKVGAVSRTDHQLPVDVHRYRVTGNLAAGRQQTPAWLEVDTNEKKGTVRGMPIREDIQIPVQEQLIVELFSK